jgi:hypothetical protein
VIPLAISSATQAIFHETLTDHHAVHVTVRATDLNGAKIADLDWRLLDGQVNIDATAAVTRWATLSLLDPNRTMAFDSGSPVDGAMFYDRMVQIFYNVLTPVGWVEVPLFTGPVTKLDRSDDVVNVECQGKERLAMGQVWRPLTYKKNARKVDVIRAILRDRAGETRFTFPESSERLPTDYAIGRMNTPWGVAQTVAKGMGGGLQLFYDGRGVCRLRPRPQTSVYHFRTGDNQAVTSPPKITYSLEDARNTVWVRGAASTATSGNFGTIKIGAVANAPYSHPLSASKLGRDVNGVRVPRYLVEEYVNPSIMTQSLAQRFADSILASRLLESVDVAFDSMPIPHLEPEDVCWLATDEFSSAFRFTRGSIPLVARDDSHMTVGYIGKVSLNARRLGRA